MDEAQLADILRSMCGDAPYGEKVTTIHLFGIRYTTDLLSRHVSINNVAKLSGVGDSYSIEVRQGVNLAKHVELKQEGASSMSGESQIEVKWDNANELFFELSAPDDHRRKTARKHEAAAIAGLVLPQGHMVHVSLVDGQGNEIRTPITMRATLSPTRRVD